MGIPTPQRLLDLTGRVAIITGSGKGLGRGIAARFAEAGATVVVNYRSSAAGAQSLVAAIEAKGGRACAIQADVTRQAESERLIVQAVETYGRLDVLINNAGLYPRSALIDMPKDGWDAVVEGNLGSAFLCLQAADEPLGKRRARIVAHLCERLFPVDELSLFSPELVGLVDRILVKLLVRRHKTPFRLVFLHTKRTAGLFLIAGPVT